MTLKAVLFGFSGVIINDRAINQQLIDEILLQENLRPSASDYWQKCLGRSDRACLQYILRDRGRVVSEAYLNKLLSNKAKAYEQRLQKLELPLYLGIKDSLALIESADLKIGLVADALRLETEFVLNCAEIAAYFDVVVSDDDRSSKKSESYLLAVERLRQQLALEPSNCLAIEDTPVGIEAAKEAGMAVVGVANTFPLHMLQRQANWAIDNLGELELERVQNVFEASSGRA